MRMQQKGTPAGQTNQGWQQGYPQHGQPQQGYPQHGHPQHGRPQGWSASWQGLVPLPPKQLTLFEPVPCPYCGTPMVASAGMNETLGRMAFGFVGTLVVTALASKHYCPAHGEVAEHALPLIHQRAVESRRQLRIAGAVALLLLVTGLLTITRLVVM